MAESDEALTWNAKALTLAENSSNERAGSWRGSLYNNIGWTHHDAGRHAEALEIFEKALAYREAAGQAPVLSDPPRLNC